MSWIWPALCSSIPAIHSLTLCKSRKLFFICKSYIHRRFSRYVVYRRLKFFTRSPLIFCRKPKSNSPTFEYVWIEGDSDNRLESECQRTSIQSMDDLQDEVEVRHRGEKNSLVQRLQLANASVDVQNRHCKRVNRRLTKRSEWVNQWITQIRILQNQESQRVDRAGDEFEEEGEVQILVDFVFGVLLQTCLQKSYRFFPTVAFPTLIILEARFFNSMFCLCMRKLKTSERETNLMR